ncbi:MAG: hypothetical protein NXI31_03950 [bacterium]|nr:hypothetical protein [bacterium]
MTTEGEYEGAGGEPPEREPRDRDAVMKLWAARVDEGYLFGGLPPAAVQTLKGVPMLLESTDERVRDRLLPETCDDAEDEEHWREHAVPELERLFMSRAQLVRRDLNGLKRFAIDGTHVLMIPHEHSSAWLAAMNAARLALFVLNDLTARDLEGDRVSGLKPKQLEAIARIDLLASIQAVLLGDFELEDAGSIDDFDLE